MLDNRLGVAEFLLYGDRVISLTFANVHKIALGRQGLEDKKFDCILKMLNMQDVLTID